LGVGRVGLEAVAVLVLDIVVGDVAPLLLAVVNVPLVKKGNGAEVVLACKIHTKEVALTYHSSPDLDETLFSGSE
jgi:hypothetical protein